jgi:hypothetical protein
MLPSLQHFRGVERRAKVKGHAGTKGHARAEGHVGALGWDQEELTSFNYSHKLAQNQRKVVNA